jgi:hypothetical protein
MHTSGSVGQEGALLLDNSIVQFINARTLSSGTAVQGTDGQGFVTGHDFSRADCSEMREGLQPPLSFHSETCVCSGEKQAAERGDARLLWQGNGVQGLKPDPSFLLLLWPG